MTYVRREGRSVVQDSQTRSCCNSSEQHEGSACACRLLLRPSCQVLRMCQCLRRVELQRGAAGSPFTALPWGWERHRPSMCSWIHWKSSLHFNELVNNPEDCWGFCCIWSLVPSWSHPQLLQNKKYFFFCSRIPSGQEAFYPQLWFRIHFCGGGFFFYPRRIYNLLSSREKCPLWSH